MACCVVAATHAAKTPLLADNKQCWQTALHNTQRSRTMTIKYWGVFVDETGCEFGAAIHAHNMEEAWELARDDYPESRCVQLESPEDTAAREQRLYASIAAEVDGYWEEYDQEDLFEDDDDLDSVDQLVDTHL
jgi:hypothetical protein